MTNVTPLPNIMVAPNGARRDKSHHPQLPVSLAEVLETAKACHAEGANGIHAHIRDSNARHLLDAAMYADILEQLQDALPDMYLQVTSESAELYDTAFQQKLVRDLRPDHVSIAMREMVRSDSDWTAATEFYTWARDANVQIQHIVYSSDELAQFLSAVEDRKIPGDQALLQFVLGTYDGTQKSDPANLSQFLDVLAAGPKQLTSDWMLCAFGPEETDCLVQAAREGGKLRVGFENSLWNANGEIAQDNAERVREVAAAVRAL